MFMLRFTVQNHGSFRDEAELSLVRSSLQTSLPKNGSWEPYVASIAAIYGANASGKSQFVDAILYFKTIIAESATSWSTRKTLGRSHFRLDHTSGKEPSTYVMDFLHNGVRHEYGFSVTRDAVIEEWLYSYPTGRKRILFERNGHDLNFGRALGGGEALLRQALGQRELVLSKGRVVGNDQLGDLCSAIVDGIDVAKFGESDRFTRLQSLIEEVTTGDFRIEDLRTMLKVADVGIAGAQVKVNERHPKELRVLRAVFEAVQESEISEEELDKIAAEAARVLLFEHIGADHDIYSLPSDLQSTGTLTWLSLAAPAISAMRRGTLFVVDELDASLHPQLAQVMIRMFADPETNPRRAQLIFTTHDTYFLSPTSELNISPEEVFFVEKGRDGASSIFSLADFPHRSDHNYSRRYLQGRYGAVPAVAPAFLASLIERNAIPEAATGERG
ncbi:ATP-binding protein [Antribacter sp. KLBMP9083]|uniref:ATP-binding protein n=1 Tax=Antribacter soli TaxID=2910976 RepID=A0AA41QGG0_9MICO|nr:ATP-binding protein [Antribacter soli]MCF4122196.1 ATP-binding protein [Antribacter soli]